MFYLNRADHEQGRNSRGMVTRWHTGRPGGYHPTTFFVSFGSFCKTSRAHPVQRLRRMWSGAEILCRCCSAPTLEIPAERVKSTRSRMTLALGKVSKSPVLPSDSQRGTGDAKRLLSSTWPESGDREPREGRSEKFKQSKERYENAEEKSGSIHPYRAAGSDRNHCDPGSYVVARFGEGKRTSASHLLYEQPAADRVGDENVGDGQCGPLSHAGACQRGRSAKPK